MSFYFALLTVETNKNKKSVKFQGDMLNYCDFIQVFVFTTNHHLKLIYQNSWIFLDQIQTNLFSLTNKFSLGAWVRLKGSNFVIFSAVSLTTFKCINVFEEHFFLNVDPYGRVYVPSIP